MMRWIGKLVKLETGCVETIIDAEIIEGKDGSFHVLECIGYERKLIDIMEITRASIVRALLESTLKNTRCHICGSSGHISVYCPDRHD